MTAGWWLVAGKAFGVQFHRPKLAKPVSSFLVFVGTDTKKGGQGVYRARFDVLTGRLTPLEVAAQTVQPSFLALGPAEARRVLYAVNEAPDATAGVTSYELDGHTGGLREIGRVATGMPGPCYISVDATGKAVITANYSGGGVTSFRVRKDGSLDGPVDHIDFRAKEYGSNGPQADRQEGPHPHSATISPDDRFVVVNDLGHDTIVTFALDAETARLTTSEPTVFHTEAGAGPRHVAFHPNGRWVYGSNELSSTVVHYLWSETHGTKPQGLFVRAHPPVKTTAAGFAGQNTAAEVVVAPNGAYLYVSNRGEDSLAVFAINQEDGSLQLLQTVSCGGKTPRQFTLDPTGRWLLCSNQNSSSVTVFRRDSGTGRLQGPVQTADVPSPYFVLFA